MFRASLEMSLEIAVAAAYLYVYLSLTTEGTYYHNGMANPTMLITVDLICARRWS